MTRRLTARQVIDRLTYGELPATEHGDPWGYAIAAHFDIAHALDDRPEGRIIEVLARWHFKRGLCMSRSLDGVSDDHRPWLCKVATDTLVRAGDILHRYEARLGRDGRSY